MGKVFGVNYDFGRQLHSAVMQAGCGSPEVRIIQPVHLRGIGKDWWHQPFGEATPVMIRAGLATDGEIAKLLAELKRLADDEGVLLAQARMPAVSAVKLNS